MNGVLDPQKSRFDRMVCSHYSVQGITTLAPFRHFDKIDRPQDARLFSLCERVVNVAMSAAHQTWHQSDNMDAVLGPWVQSHRLGDPIRKHGIRNRAVYEKLLWPKTMKDLFRSGP